MTERIPKSVFLAASALFLGMLVYLAYTQPYYFTNQTLLGGLVLVEFLAVAVWMYRRVFFALIIVAFLFAGLNLHGGFWTVLRWVFLSIGALVGLVLILKERSHHFGLFHVLAAFTIMTALVSSAVSQFPQIALLKVLSLLLLFLYASTGARLSVTGRENRFFTGLLTGCEVFVGSLAVFYAFGIEVMGNPNSLGVVTGIVGVPILLWGIVLKESPFVHFRRLALFGVCMYLLFHSHSRAAIAAAIVSSGLLCFALRKYKIALQGATIMVVLISVAAIIQPEALSNFVSDLRMSVVYKGGEESLLLSRESPWEESVESIRKHFWFGTGLGTAENSNDPRTQNRMAFSSNSKVTTEHGSSYLAILSGVGVLGVLPFSGLLILLFWRIVRTVSWLRATGNPCHPAVPLAMVVLAGLIHAGFEDWLFAPGYYLCVFFWSLAFVFVDVAASPVPRFASWLPFRSRQRGFGEAVPSR